MKDYKLINPKTSFGWGRPIEFGIKKDIKSTYTVYEKIWEYVRKNKGNIHMLFPNVGFKKFFGYEKKDLRIAELCKSFDEAVENFLNVIFNDDGDYVKSYYGTNFNKSNQYQYDLYYKSVNNFIFYYIRTNGMIILCNLSHENNLLNSRVCIFDYFGGDGQYPSQINGKNSIHVSNNKDIWYLNCNTAFLKFPDGVLKTRHEVNRKNNEPFFESFKNVIEVSNGYSENYNIRKFDCNMQKGCYTLSVKDKNKASFNLFKTWEYIEVVFEFSVLRIITDFYHT